MKKNESLKRFKAKCSDDMESFFSSLKNYFPLMSKSDRWQRLDDDEDNFVLDEETKKSLE